MWTSLLSILLISNVALAKTSTNPKISFQEYSHNFGQVFRGQKLTYDFSFKNRGQAPLMIVGTHSGCGCTALEVDGNKAYQPGESGVVRVSFDTKDFSGKVVKVLTVMTNERITPMRTLTIKADIKEEFIVSPPLADFGRVDPSQEHRKVIRFSSANEKPFEITKIKYPSSRFEVKHKPLGRNIELTVLLLKGARPGPLNETIEVYNNSKSLPMIPVYVTGSVAGNIQASTKNLKFGSVGKKDQENLELRLNGKQDFQVTSFDTDLYLNGSPIPNSRNLLTVDIDKTKAAQKIIKVSLANQGEQAGVVHGKLRLQTDDSLQRTIDIELRGFFE